MPEKTEEKKHEPPAEGTYLWKLEQWIKNEREKNGLVDIKFFPRMPDDPPFVLEEFARAILETLEGTRPTDVLSTEKL